MQDYSANYGWSIVDTLVVVGIIVVAILTVGMILARLYQRASKEVSYVRTGLGGQRVIMNGGAIVLPVLHETIPVNMNTLRLEVRRSNEQALITRDRMRVDVLAEFYVRVQPTTESIAAAAQTLGRRTMVPDDLRELVEGKFVDALRAVAAEMAMEELHEQRVSFVQKVQTAVSEDLLKNGLELESVSLTGLDQTNREHFNPDNAFDAAGLTKLTHEIEDRRKRRNEIEQDSQVAIQQKNLEAEKLKLSVKRDTEYAQLEQEREVETRRAAQMAEIAEQRSGKQQEADEAEILARRQVDVARIAAERMTEEARITKEQEVRTLDITRERSIETADIERRKTVALADQDREIAIAEKSRAQSEAQAEADEARALATRASEQVVTVRETEVAERQKAVQLVDAQREAEREAIGRTVAAEAEKQAAEDEAEAIRTLADAAASKVKTEADGDAEAEKLRAAAAELRYAADAAGRKALNEADNLLSTDIVAMRVRLSVIEKLRDIVAESVKPIENIDSIKILHVDGLGANGGAGNGTGGGAGDSGGAVSDRVVDSALRYRAQAPLVDAILKEIGLDGAAGQGLEALLANKAGEVTLASRGGEGAAES